MTVCECFTASILVLYIRISAKVLIKKNVNISKELNFSAVY